MRILITDSDSRSALAATRSLGRRGHTVITAGEHAASLAAVSRYSADFVQYPSPAHHPDQFIASIVRATNAHRVDVLLPMTEVTTLLLTNHRQQLAPTCHLPFADTETIARASDKSRMVELAQQLGVPTPATVRVAHVDELDRLELPPYPIVIKPSRSRVRTESGWVGTSVTYAADRAELESRLRRLRPDLYPVLLQERIGGPGVGFFACYDRGRLVATFAHRRLREKPPSGGVSTLCESTAVDPQALESGSRLLSHLGWHGVAMVEFKRDDQDGTLRLMEINARFWGSLQLAIDAGVDFPGILVDIAMGRNPPASPTYRLGARSRWLLGDLDVALMVLLRTRKSLNLPPSFPTRLRFLKGVLRVSGPEERSEIYDRDDPRPWRLELRQWLLRSRF